MLEDGAVRRLRRFPAFTARHAGLSVAYYSLIVSWKILILLIDGWGRCLSA